MAGALALNTYKTFRNNVTTGITTMYTAPNGIKDVKIPANDALNPIEGSLVLEVGDKIEVQGSENSKMKYTLSILESAK